MRIRNNTGAPIVVSMRWKYQPGVDVGNPGWDDREELLKPGQETDDYINLSNSIFEPEIIAIEEV